MIVVEQEASLNGQDFLECFSSSIRYYSIVFDSLDKDNFNHGNHCKVLWEMYFRRQISNLVAQQNTDQIVGLQTFAEWRERLFHSGFHHVRLQTQFKGTLLGILPEYHIEEKNRHPVLYRHDDPLLFTSAWKPDPTKPNSESWGSWNQESSLRNEATIPGGSSGPPILAGTVSSSFLDDQPDYPHIIIEGNVWSPECSSINQIAASAEIFDMMEYICHVHYLPLALTWMSDSRFLHLEKSACYLNDFTMVEFMEACGEHHLEEGKGVAGKALQLNSMYFVSDISKLDVNDYPFIFDSWEFGLHGVVAIKLASMHISSINYVLEFFLPLEMKEISAQRLLVNEIVSILQKNSRNSWRVCNDELSRADICSEVEIMAEEVRTITITPAAIPTSQPQELSESGSLNSSQIRYQCNVFNPPGDEVRVPETHDQEVEQQNSIFRPAVDHFNTSEVEIMAEEVGTNTITQAAIPASQPPELPEIGCLSSFSWLNFNPPGDEVRVPETHDQEVEQQNSIFRPAADLFPEYEVDGVDSYHFNAGTSSKRRRTSEVWQYFDELWIIYVAVSVVIAQGSFFFAITFDPIMEPCKWPQFGKLFPRSTLQVINNTN
ncbi:hypothetical protein OIU77_002159 [Salix suchowensis]|uniref:NLP1-9 GAF domain-containing protein n=1 Tax=Salix suchowensis TaxID=1278906 RepID=A0ABQ9B3T8_9ROSI|nr:hypothetical protein OIU77_002159 [Salix suchowensis]